MIPYVPMRATSSAKLNVSYLIIQCTVYSESCYALIQDVESDFHERLYRINWIKQLHTLPALHFNHCLTTEYSETAAHCNGDFDTDNQIYVVHSDFPNARYSWWTRHGMNLLIMQLSAHFS
jgi:hypothetical protein